MDLPTSVFTGTPDFLLGVDGGQSVLIPPGGVSSAGKPLGSILLTSGQAAAIGSRPLNTWVLCGDSQTGNTVAAIPNAVTAVSYVAATGVLTFTSSAHGVATGRSMCVLVRGDPKWNTYETAATRIDANNFSVVVSTGLGGLPDPTLTWVSSNGAWNDVGVVGKVQSATGGRLDVLRIAGVSGETTAQIMARLPLEVFPLNPALISLQFGNNDQNTTTCPNATAAAAYAATVFATAKAGIALCVAAGAKIIVETLTPLLSGYALNTVPVRVFAVELNRLIKTLPNLYPGVAIADSYGACVDTAGAITGTTGAGSALSGYIKSDGLHRTPKAMTAISALYATIINAWFPALVRLPTSQVDSYDGTINPSAGNKQINSMLLTNIGGSSPAPITNTNTGIGFACSIGAGATATATVQAAGTSGGTGNSQKLAVSISGAGFVSFLGSQNHAAQFSPGQKVKLRLRWKTTGFAATGFIRYIQLSVSATVDGNTLTQGVYNSGSSTPTDVSQTDLDGYVEGAAFPIPAGASLTSLTWNMIVFTSADVASACAQEVSNVDLSVTTVGY